MVRLIIGVILVLLYFLVLVTPPRDARDAANHAEFPVAGGVLMLLPGLALSAWGYRSWKKSKARKDVTAGPSPAHAKAVKVVTSGFRCGGCGKVLEEIGVPPQISFVQMYKQVANIGSESVPPEIKADPFLYRGLYCPSCNQVFCPTCAGMQSERCPRCQNTGLMPGYRPLLKRIAA